MWAESLLLPFLAFALIRLWRRGCVSLARWGEGGGGRRGGGALFIIQPAEIASSSFSRGQICAILKRKSCDLLTVLNG